MIETKEVVARAQMADNFLASHRAHRAAIREKSSRTNVNFLTAHRFALGAVVSYQSRIRKLKIDYMEDDVQLRISLVSQFIDGADIIEMTISEGAYEQAANLLRQGIGTLSAIEELESEHRKRRYVPKTQRKLKEFGTRFGKFGEVSYPGRDVLLNDLSSISEYFYSKPKNVPNFNPISHRILYGNHVLLMLILFSQMQPLFVEAFNVDWDDVEVKLVANAVKILIDEGIIKETPICE